VIGFAFEVDSAVNIRPRFAPFEPAGSVENIFTCYIETAFRGTAGADDLKIMNAYARSYFARCHL